MTISPISADIQSAYRQAFKAQVAPAVFDTETPLTPVALVGGNLGLPRPLSNQKLRYSAINASAANTNFQLSTASSSLRVYFLYAISFQFAAVASGAIVFDATSGSGSAPGANSNTLDDAGYLVQLSLPATIGSYADTKLPLPVELKNGLRINAGAAGVSNLIYVFWIEENV